MSARILAVGLFLFVSGCCCVPPAPMCCPAPMSCGPQISPYGRFPGPVVPVGSVGFGGQAPIKRIRSKAAELSPITTAYNSHNDPAVIQQISSKCHCEKCRAKRKKSGKTHTNTFWTHSESDCLSCGDTPCGEPLYAGCHHNCCGCGEGCGNGCSSCGNGCGSGCLHGCSHGGGPTGTAGKSDAKLKQPVEVNEHDATDDVPLPVPPPPAAVPRTIPPAESAGGTTEPEASDSDSEPADDSSENAEASVQATSYTIPAQSLELPANPGETTTIPSTVVIKRRIQ